MKAKIIRDAELIECKTVTIELSGTTFRIKETFDNKLEITKINDDSNALSIQPMVTNQIIIY